MPITLHMVIEKITRTYSRSINLKSFGSKAESWVKCEATYEAQCESGDDPLKCSEMLAEQVQKDVAGQISTVIQKVQSANPSTVPATQVNPAGAPAVATTAAPRAL